MSPFDPRSGAIGGLVVGMILMAVVVPLYIAGLKDFAVTLLLAALFAGFVHVLCAMIEEMRR